MNRMCFKVSSADLAAIWFRRAERLLLKTDELPVSLSAVLQILGGALYRSFQCLFALEKANKLSMGFLGD